MPTSPDAARPSPRQVDHDTVRLRVWDLPTRIFHWSFAAAVVGQLATGFGGIMEWHFRIGYAVLALLLFRVVWGFVGGRWSRFAEFVYSPRSLMSYLAGRAHPDHLVGHTPLGAMSVFALLAILTLQVGSGLFSDDEIAASGPLTRFASGSTVSLATGWHATWGKWFVIALACLHVAAVIYYVRVKRQTLVRPMFSGDKPIARGAAEPSRDDVATRLLALMIFALCASLSAWVASLRA